MINKQKEGPANDSFYAANERWRMSLIIVRNNKQFACESIVSESLFRSGTGNERKLLLASC